MEWWSWTLIIVGVIVIGVIKIVVLKKLKQSKASKRRFVDEE